MYEHKPMLTLMENVKGERTPQSTQPGTHHRRRVRRASGGSPRPIFLRNGGEIGPERLPPYTLYAEGGLPGSRDVPGGSAGGFPGSGDFSRRRGVRRPIFSPERRKNRSFPCSGARVDLTLLFFWLQRLQFFPPARGPTADFSPGRREYRHFPCSGPLLTSTASAASAGATAFRGRCASTSSSSSAAQG